MRHLANIHMSYDIDYRKAYRYLKLARQIAEEDGNDYDLCYILMSLANLYSMNGGFEDKEISQVLHSIIKDGTKLSMKSGNDIALSCFLVDIAIMIGFSDDIDSYREIVDMAFSYRYKNAKYVEHSKYRETSDYILKGLRAYFAKDYASAESEFVAASKGLDGITFGERLYFPINIFLIKLYRITGQTEKATSLGRSLLEISIDNGHRDYELNMNQVLYETYKTQGISDSSEYYHDRYLRLAETLKETSGFGSVKTLDFMSEIDRINNEVENLSLRLQKRQKVQIIIVAALCMLILVIAALLWNYITLKRNHRTLFNRNEDMTRQSVIHGMMRKKLEEEKRELEALLKAEKENNSTSEVVTREQQQTESIGRVIGDLDKEEYEQMQKLFTRIVDVMESSGEIYKQKFALNDLASLVGTSPRLVSKAINMCYNSNFHQFLIDYRIREVSRLMHEPSMRNMTIESLSERAGFSSRTYFATVFKKSTGLTPSEYIKMVKKRISC